MAAPRVQIRSFRVCFKLERRIHKIDRWRVPLPFGVPLAGAGYAIVALIAVVMTSRFPVVGDMVRVLPPPIRFAVLPIGIAYGLTRWEIDGRAGHATLTSLVRMRLGPSRVAAFRPAPPPGPVTLGSITIAGDDRSARWRPAVVLGPARVVLRYPIRTNEQRRTLQIWREPGPPRFRGVQITLEPGQRAVIR